MEQEAIIELRNTVQQFVRLFGLLEQTVTPCGFPLSTSQVYALQELEKKMRIYLETQGVKLSRSFIELDSGILIAGIIPKVVE